jgi:hypothetical protein
MKVVTIRDAFLIYARPSVDVEMPLYFESCTLMCPKII